jgi:hypothetical protein
MAWYNSGSYSGLAVHELRSVLAEFCTVTNELQFALNRPLTDWGSYEGVTIPAYPTADDFTGLAVAYIGTVLGRIQYSLVARNKFYGYGGSIIPPFSDGGAIIPLINTYDYPSWQSISYYNTRLVADEDGGLLDPLDIVASAGYGDDWLPVSRAIGSGSQDLSDAAIGQVFTADPSAYDDIRHTNYRLYDQIRHVLEQLKFIQGKVWWSPVAYSDRGYHSSSISQEDAYDEAVSDLGDYGEYSMPGTVGRMMIKSGMYWACALKNATRVNMNFGMLKAGEFRRHEVYLVGFSGHFPYGTPPNWTLPFHAADFTVTDSDSDTYDLNVTESGIEEFTQIKPESKWATSPHVIEFTMPIPGGNPFDAAPDPPPPPPVVTYGAVRGLWWDQTETEHGLYTRELSVGHGLTYG